jgi:beta-glucosidase-like glycosyl hydrolase
MKSLRYIIVAILALVAVDAMAWTAEVNKAVLMLAEENLSKRSAKAVESLLGNKLSSVEFTNKGESKTRLDENGKSVTTDEKDAVVLLEKAIATLENKGATAEERKAALLTAVEMTVDIHCMANVLIDKHFEKDFTFTRHNTMQVGFRYYRVTKTSWQELWHEEYHATRDIFSPEMYLYDWQIATKGMAKHYKKEAVAPRKWAEQTGERALHAFKVIRPDAVIDKAEVYKLYEVTDSCIHDAVFRLANLLNKSLK